MFDNSRNGEDGWEKQSATGLLISQLIGNAEQRRKNQRFKSNLPDIVTRGRYNVSV